MLSQESPQRILIVLHGAIGDVVQAFPLLPRLKQHHPGHHITWAVEPAARSLVEGHPLVDRTVVFHRSGGIRAYLEFIKELRASGPYDVVLDLQRHFKSGVTSLLSAGKTRIGFHRRGSREGNWFFQHHHIPPVEKLSPKIKQFQLFGDLLSLPRSDVLNFGIQIPESSVRHLANVLRAEGHLSERPLVALVIGASWKSKIWPLKHFQALGRDLFSECALQPVLVGGAAEAARVKSYCSDMNESKSNIIDLTGKTSLMELAALFKQCALVIACDSGPMHLAAAMGVPVISLWGPTSPNRSAPYGSEPHGLQSAIGCSPCYRRECPGLGTLCLQSLPPAAVLAKVQQLMTLCSKSCSVK